MPSHGQAIARTDDLCVRTDRGRGVEKDRQGYEGEGAHAEMATGMALPLWRRQGEMKQRNRGRER